MLFFKRRKPVEQVPSALEIARAEFHAAVERRNHILENFDNVLPEYFEVANAELTAATMEVDACTKKLKIIQASMA